MPPLLSGSLCGGGQRWTVSFRDDEAAGSGSLVEQFLQRCVGFCGRTGSSRDTQTKV